MRIKTGCDLVVVKKFEQSVRRGDKAFLNNVFSSQELAGDYSTESLAGMFAAKEAVIKALGEVLQLKAGDWKKIEIMKNTNGRPEVKLLESNDNIVSRDISISHDGEYAIAVAVFIVDDPH